MPNQGGDSGRFWERRFLIGLPHGTPEMTESCNNQCESQRERPKPVINRRSHSEERRLVVGLPHGKPEMSESK
jgi:hypothetical protein